jgi:hypothetical protein
MNLVQSAAVFLPGVLTGILVVALFWHAERSSLTTWILKLSLGIGIGIGLITVLYFFYMLLFAGRHFFIYVQILVVLILVVLTLRRRSISFQGVLSSMPWAPWQVALMLSLLVIAALALLAVLQVWLHDAYGGWDAFMIYNRTARFIYRGQAGWTQAFSPDIWAGFHADYPLLIPLSVAQGWEVLGRESLTVPRLLSGAFMLACIMLFAAGVSRFRSVWQAAVGLAVLLNIQSFLREGMSQTADLPLAFYMLCTSVLIFIYSSDPEQGILILAGLTTGLAAWTKNEGVLFVVAVTIGLFVAFVRQGQASRLRPFLAGAAVPALALLWFKVFMAPPNDLIGTTASGLIELVIDWQRHASILHSLYAQIAGGGFLLSVSVILTAYALAFGISPQRQLKAAYIAVLVSLGIQAAGYYSIYLITPHSIEWQLDSSLPRLLFHIYLPLLFVFFVLVTDVPRALGFQSAPAPAESTA